MDYTQSSFLNEYRVYLKVSVYDCKTRNLAEANINIKSLTNCKALCDPVLAEIYIRPPTQQQVMNIVSRNNAFLPFAQEESTTINENNNNGNNQSANASSTTVGSNTPVAVLAIPRVSVEIQAFQ